MKKILLYATAAVALLAATPALAHEACNAMRTTELREFGGRSLAVRSAPDAEVPLWEGLLGHHFPATTASAEAQSYIDQAMMLTFGFNHAEAGRSFRKARALDPTCAICAWGEALVLGPNLNAPMDPAANAPALEALAIAQSLAGGASPRERALIEALGARYSREGVRADLDAAYAEAMAAVAEAFPEDDDILVLFAEAMMDLQPWDFWEADGAPKGRTAEIVETLERVLARNPDHVGAIHLYIHAVEASTAPERAEPYADRLAAMDLAAGHLVHMPSHIYYRVGRYADSLEANRRAVAVDEAFFAQVPAEGIYGGAYYPHNIHFLLVSAQMAGDGPTVIEAAEKLSAVISDDLARAAPGFVQPIKAAPLYAHAQFSQPQDVIALPRPTGEFPFIDAVWHYARGVAFATMGDIEAAVRERAAIETIARTGDLAPLANGGMPIHAVLAIAGHVLDARIAQRQGDWAISVTHLAQAKVLEDGLPYMEPRYWYAPVGQSLGAAHLKLGHLDAAETAFLESLELAPNNGFALFGLGLVHEARGDDARAEEIRAKLDAAFVGDRAMLSLERL